MRTPRVLSGEAVRFRKFLIDRLGADRFFYFDEDRWAGTCPVCGAWIGVRFHGCAPRADLDCYLGCTEDEIAAAIGLEVRT